MNKIQKTLFAPVVREVVVSATPERAFEVFIEQIGSWWPKGHSLIDGTRKSVVIEAKPGGCWYETGADGSRCEWGEVLEIEPGKRLLLSWQLSDVWELNPEARSDVEVTFVAEGENTHVRLEHRNFERWGDNAQAGYEAISGDGGWMGILNSYVDTVTA